ncbi:MAG: hypothetical protein HKN26_05400 [Acidimicrobiales bacterium]|nr:hypothetical protein [Acidimicrobiales bacterium]
MNGHRHHASTGQLLLALALLPVVLVSAIALMVDITSSADPGRAASGIVATVIGLGLGAATIGLLRSIADGLRLLAAGAAGWVAAGHGWPIPQARARVVAQSVPVRVAPVRRQPLVRRGPPELVR